MKTVTARKRQLGFTLLEATVAMVLLAVAAAGILLPFAGAANEQAEGTRRTMAAHLASELLEKIAATDFDAIVSTYGGYTESAGGLLDSAEQLHTGSAYAGFSRTATCGNATAASVDVITVTVAVLYNGDEVTRVTTLVCDN